MSEQIGVDYTFQSVPNPHTLQKTRILARTKPQQASTISSLFNLGPAGLNSLNNLAGDVNNAAQQVDKYTYNLIKTLYTQEAAIARTSGKIVTNINDGLSEGFADVVDTFDSVSAKINDTLKPVSTSIGSVLGSLTGVMKDPLGSITLLPDTLSDIVKKVNPEFAARMEASFKKTKIDNLTHLPGQLMGSLRSLIMAADKILALPLIIISDLYQGFLQIMEEISDIVNQAFDYIINWFFGPEGLLDSILPISAILEFLEAASELMAEIQGLTTIFLGANPIAGFALDIQNYSRQVQGILTNPKNLIISYLPPAVTEGLYTLNNPQQLINSILPSSLTNEFAKLGSIIGVGFNGNMGFGFEAVLNQLKGGVISSVISGFANQYSILTPLLQLGVDKTVPLNESLPPGLEPNTANPNGEPTAQGVPQPQQPPSKPISEEE